MAAKGGCGKEYAGDAPSVTRHGPGQPIEIRSGGDGKAMLGGAAFATGILRWRLAAVSWNGEHGPQNRGQGTALLCPVDARENASKENVSPTKESMRFKTMARSWPATRPAPAAPREDTVVPGLPASTSIERLEILDDGCHILSFSIVGGEHRLRNYRSVSSITEFQPGPYRVFVESYVVPDGWRHRCSTGEKLK
ncbi:hypothetical protein ZWY2020_056407 [Hordeum vulgare]|nr:hypothetical protein ZWY2020_056407 [Hordeum vulgare]